jgi:hypothetical protein
MTTLLGIRRLRIYWVTSAGWSKRLRDRSGGITALLEAIAKAGVIDPSQPLCVVANKDDADGSRARTVFGIYTN